VEHAVPFEAVKPWRTAAMVASGVAVVELALLIVGGTVVLGRSVVRRGGHAAVRPASTAAARKPARHVLVPRTRTRVVVLNGNGQAGAAAAEASAIRARGYKIGAVGNAPRSSMGPTLVMYRPGFAAEAHRLARDTGIGVVTALDGLQPSSLGRGQLVIVLGAS
jgi:LytR cell envelope-related transcriptional attenuator